jgi:hypothetical protein
MPANPGQQRFYRTTLDYESRTWSAGPVTTSMALNVSHIRDLAVNVICKIRVVLMRKPPKLSTQERRISIEYYCRALSHEFAEDCRIPDSGTVLLCRCLRFGGGV